MASVKRVFGKAERGWAVFAVVALAVLLAGAGFAHASEPHNWQLGFQEPASPVKARIESLHNLLLWIITGITIFVLVLLVYVMWRFSEKRNPVPSRTSHNTFIEIAWTLVPVLILLVIAVPSFKLLYYMDKTQQADMTLKVTGAQWFWKYEYPDQGGFTFDSYMIAEKDIKPGQKRLLDVDNEVVVPVDTNIRVLIAGQDVMHSWFVPSLGVQKYAVIGRLNETWMRVDREGVYYGQCNQICGVNHAYMPIKVHAVSKEAFAKWAAEAKTKFAKADESSPVQLAAAAQ